MTRKSWKTSATLKKYSTTCLTKCPVAWTIFHQLYSNTYQMMYQLDFTRELFTPHHLQHLHKWLSQAIQPQWCGLQTCNHIHIRQRCNIVPSGEKNKNKKSRGNNSPKTGNIFKLSGTMVNFTYIFLVASHVSRYTKKGWKKRHSYVTNFAYLMHL